MPTRLLRLRIPDALAAHGAATAAHGAQPEAGIGPLLDSLAGAGAVVLHHQHTAGSHDDIAHLVVAPSGVWLIDPQRCKGQVERRDVGDWLQRNEHLYVGSRDKSRLVEAVAVQAETMRTAVGDAADVTPVLCLTDADWGLFHRPFEIGEVVVAWPEALVDLIAGRVTRRPLDVAAVADRLSSQLAQ